ncbi:MAG: hypothetical protein WBE86_01710 [Candidatus Acidiferrales bacterium]
MSRPKKSRPRNPAPKEPGYSLKLKIEGPGVHRKSIAIPDLLKVCDAIQSAIHRQAEAMQRPSALTLRRGPITATAQAECTLELVGISGGSTGLLFRYAKPQQPFPGMVTFGMDAIAKVAETIKEFGGERKAAPEIDPGVLDSLTKLGEVLDPKVITRISLAVPRRENGKSRPIKAVLTPAVRDRITARVRVPTHSPFTIEGKLEMADFKETGKICRVHPPIGLPVQCTFEPEFEEQVYSALRKPARISGIAKLNPNTGRPEELRIEKIEILDELMLGAKDFFVPWTIEKLAQAQGINPLNDPGDLAGGWPADENLDEFLSEIHQSRS